MENSSFYLQENLLKCSIIENSRKQSIFDEMNNNDVESNYTCSFEGTFNMNFKYPAEVSKAKEKSYKSKIIHPLTNKPLPLDVNPEDLKTYSVLYPIFFNFLQTCIMSLTILFCISCIFDLIASYLLTILYGNYDHSVISAQDLFQICAFSTVMDILDSNTDEKMIIFIAYITIKMVLNLTSMIYLRNYVKKSYDKLLDKYDFLKIKNISESDFCVLLSNIPKSTNYAGFTSKLIKFNRTIDIFNFKGVIMLQNCEKYMKYSEKRTKLLRRLSRKKAAPDLELQIRNITDKMNYFKANSIEHPEFIGKALICFENTFDTRKFMEQFSSNTFSNFDFCEKILTVLRITEKPLQPMLLGKLVKVEPVPEPGDIKWENLHLSQKELSIRKILAVVFLTISVIFLSSILLYFAYGKISNGGNTILNIKAMILTIGIGIIKILIEILINLIAKMTRMISNSAIEIFKLKGRLIFSFINLYAVIYSTAFFYGQNNQVTFILNLFLTLLLMIILPQILAWFDPELLFKFMQRLGVRNKIFDDYRTQKDCNDLFRNPEFPFMIRINDSAQVYFLALSFYAIFPLAVPICMLGLYAIWLNDKFMILRVYSKTKLVRLDFGLWFFKVFEYDIVIQLLGNGIYLFTLTLYYISSVNYSEIIFAFCIIIIMIIIIIIYYGKFHISFGSKPISAAINEFVNYQYDDFKRDFPTTYHMEYPLNNSKRRTFHLDRIQMPF